MILGRMDASPFTAHFDALRAHAARLADTPLRELAATPGRATRLALRVGPLYANFARQRYDDAAIDALFALANTVQFPERVVDLFEGKRVQLIEGTIIIMSPTQRAHWVGVGLVAEELRKAFADGYYVATHVPLNLGGSSDPEPDAAVVRGRPRDYITGISETAALVVEVSDTTLRFDRRQKASLYAKAGIPEY